MKQMTVNINGDVFSALRSAGVRYSCGFVQIAGKVARASDELVTAVAEQDRYGSYAGIVPVVYPDDVR